MDDLKTWTAQRAKELRKTQTPYEEKLWRYLRGKRFSGFKFKRQGTYCQIYSGFCLLRSKVDC